MDLVNFDHVKKTLRFVPDYIRTKLLAWALTVELEGLNQARKVPGFHDEPLQGKRFGQRSIRLSLSYRAIYVEFSKGNDNTINVIEVSKHDY